MSSYIEEADSEDRTEVISTDELCSETEAANKQITRDGLRRGPFQQSGNLILGTVPEGWTGKSEEE